VWYIIVTILNLVSLVGHLGWMGFGELHDLCCCTHTFISAATF